MCGVREQQLRLSYANVKCTRVLQVLEYGFTHYFRSLAIPTMCIISRSSALHLDIVPVVQRTKFPLACACSWNVPLTTLKLGNLPFHFCVPV